MEGWGQGALANVVNPSLRNFENRASEIGCDFQTHRDRTASMLESGTRVLADSRERADTHRPLRPSESADCSVHPQEPRGDTCRESRPDFRDPVFLSDEAPTGPAKRSGLLRAELSSDSRERVDF